MSQKRIVEVDLISSHQLRPYGDTIYEGYLTFSVPEGQMYASKFPSKREQVEPYARLMIASWSENPDPFDNRLDLFEQVSTEPNKWHIIVRRYYND